MPTAAHKKTDARTTRAVAAPSRAKRRLAISRNPPHGHENLRGVDTDLVAERPGPVLQSLERAWVRVLAQLAHIAGHRLELGLQGPGNINPGIRNERPGVSPLRAAGRVEGVDGVDEVLRRPGGDQGRLEEKMVIAVDVAAILAIDNPRPHLLDQPFQGAD